MKMKVGEIEFDSESSISFEGQVNSVPTGPVSPAPKEDGLDPVDRKAQQTLAVAGMLMVMLTGAFVLAGALLNLTALLAVGGLTAVLAMSCLVAYIGISITRQLSPAVKQVRDEGADRLLQTRASRLREHLTHEPVTVDQLLERTGWTEAALLPALAQLAADGEVDEDLDLDSGAWTYRTLSGALSAERPRHTLSLEDRIASVSSDQTQPQTLKKDR